MAGRWGGRWLLVGVCQRRGLGAFLGFRVRVVGGVWLAAAWCALALGGGLVVGVVWWDGCVRVGACWSEVGVSGMVRLAIGNGW